MAWCLLAAWLPLDAAAARAAELLPRTDQPYRMAIALQFSDDPTFTRFFQGAVVREVRDQLANYFGPLAEVEVVTEHPLLERLSRDGPADSSRALAEMALAPADCAQPTVDKAFVVLVDCEGGIYRIQWRQLSFEAQHAGPLQVRQTPDRHWLAKAICLAVRDDFAPVAIIEPGQTKEKVRLLFHGADFLADGKPRLADWLKAGCVLRPLWVVRDRSGSLSRMPIPHTAIALESSGDFSLGAVVTTRSDPWKLSPRVAGFQAIKVSTRPGRFRLRLASAERPDKAVREGCAVFASPARFSTDPADRQPSPDPNGLVVSRSEFPGAAFVTIRRGVSDYQVLVPITAELCDVEYRLPEDANAGLKSDWQRRLRYVIQDLQVLQGIADQRVREVNALNTEKRYEEALKRVKATLADLAPIQLAEKSVAALADEAGKIGAGSDGLLRWARQQVEDLQRRSAAMAGLEKSLDDTIRQIDARNRARVLRELAFQSEESGDIDGAIEKYKLSLKENPEQPEVQSHLNELEEAWRIKGPEHRDAREYVFKTFLATGVQGLQDELPRARRAFETLRAVGDALTARRLVRALDRQLNDLAQLVEMLEARGTAADRQECDRYVKVSDAVSQLRTEVRDWVVTGRSSPEKPPAEKKPAAKDKPAAGDKPAAEKPAAGEKPAAEEKPDSKEKPAAPPKPVGDGKPEAKQKPPGDSKPVPSGKPPEIEEDQTAEPAKKP